jgi:Permuted papain-like amidase enzyme, YaeF/YiiX, C92 family
MKRLSIFYVILLLGGSAWAGPDFSAFKDGDIIFQNISFPQSEAIQHATGSPYTHMGIIFYQDGKPYVFEAISTVHYTPMGEWIARSVGGEFVVKRLKDHSVLNSKTMIDKLRLSTKYFNGKFYDWDFKWSDERIYCSELVWKLYDRALGIQLGKPRKLKEYNIDDPIVTLGIKARYGSNIPLDEVMISPADIFVSDKLVAVPR